MADPKIAVGINLYNEANTIMDCLMSVKLADHIIMIDGRYPELSGPGLKFSTDGSLDLVLNALEKNLLKSSQLILRFCLSNETEKRTLYIKWAQKLLCDWLLVLDGDEIFRSSWHFQDWLDPRIDEYTCLMCAKEPLIFHLSPVPRMINLRTAKGYKEWNVVEYNTNTPVKTHLPIVIEHVWNKRNPERRKQQDKLYEHPHYTGRRNMEVIK